MSVLTRRAVLTAAGTAGIVLMTSGMASATSVKAARVRLRLPGPRGPWAIGTTALHLIDRSRSDPWAPGSPRELMISLWYPTGNTGGFRRAPWLPPAATAVFRQQTSQSLQTSLDSVDFPTTHGYCGAPVHAGRNGRPVVLFSAAFGAVREFGTALVEDLASQGYVVVTVDHTYEAQVVEFPGGRLALSRMPDTPTDDDIALALRVRQDDIRFVLDELARLSTGEYPHPARLRGSLDLTRIGIFGHSLGGDTAAEVMAQDNRIRAGVDLDGSINGPAARTGLDRPFLLMSSAGHGRDNDPSWAQFWSNLRGWRLQLQLADSGHYTYTDLAPLARQLEKALPIPPDTVSQLTDLVGTIDAERAVAVQRSYLDAFFDLQLRHRDSGLLEGPSPRYPEMNFLP